MNLHLCPVCGNSGFTECRILWPNLVEEWRLRPSEVEYINRQQGRCCTGCGANWRSQALAEVICKQFDYPGHLTSFVRDRASSHLRVLEINTAGQLGSFLEKMPGHQRVEFPQVDMQALPFAAKTFDLVVHSDTLEHVPNPILGMQECRRVLADGGRCLFTVPIVVGRLTQNRHGLPPSYHGNEQNPDDCLVHSEFGSDVWEVIFHAGFSECVIHAMDFPSAMVIEGTAGSSSPIAWDSPGRDPSRFVASLSGCRAHEYNSTKVSVNEWVRAAEEGRRSREELDAVLKSTSWRITAPLRWIIDRLKCLNLRGGK